jgi:hypothetical protein
VRFKDSLHLYQDVEDFLGDMRDGTLKEGFIFSQEVWNGLMEKVNTDPVFAGDIIDNGILLLMAADSKSEIDGLMVLAEVCRENTVKTGD